MHHIQIICRTLASAFVLCLIPVLFLSLLVLSLLSPIITQASDDAAHDDAAQLDELRANIKLNLSDIPIDHLAATRVPGIYEIISEGQVYYVDSTASYLFDGSLVDLKGRKNLTELSMVAQNLRYIDAIGEENMLIYESANTESTRSMSVFTDLDCPFCQRLHSELDVLLDAGVKVRYLLYPREGLNTQAHKKLESVWCASNPHAAMTAAKQGELAPDASCDNPIAQHVVLAQQLGLTATPMIYLDDGQRINGYLDANTLLEVFNESTPLEH